MFSNNHLKNAGADEVYDDIEKLSEDMIWFESNINFFDFMELKQLISKISNQ